MTAVAGGTGAGRVVVGHVMPEVRAAVGRSVPIVEATPDQLEDVVRAIAAERDAARATAAEGVAFASEVHDGRRSAGVLQAVLSVRGADGRLSDPDLVPWFCVTRVAEGSSEVWPDPVVNCASGS